MTCDYSSMHCSVCTALCAGAQNPMMDTYLIKTTRVL